MSPDQVTAVLVTRGDVDLQPILNSLIFDDVVVWDNSQEERDLGTWGRYAGLFRAKHEIYYSQDDDIVHTPENQQRIIDAYEPGVMTGCMWHEWSEGARTQGIENGYDDLVFAGSGSVWDWSTPTRAMRSYLEHYPEDEFSRLWADTIIGVIAPSKHLYIRFDALPCAERENRMCNLPDAVALKTEAIRRARSVRDLVAA